MKLCFNGKTDRRLDQNVDDNQVQLHKENPKKYKNSQLNHFLLMLDFFNFQVVKKRKKKYFCCCMKEGCFFLLVSNSECFIKCFF